jgi:hypothetical protein
LLINVNVFVEGFQVRALLYHRAGFGSHEEAVEAIDAVGRVEGREAFAFVADWDGPKGVQAIALEIILAVVELDDFASCEWYCACAWLQAFVHECVDGDPEAVVGISLGLPWGEFGDNDQTVDANWIRAGFDDRLVVDEVSYDS